MQSLNDRNILANHLVKLLLDTVILIGYNYSKKLKKTNNFAFAEDLREALATNADVFEITKVDKETPFYESLMN